MAYDDKPSKRSSTKEDSDSLLSRVDSAYEDGDRTDAGSEGYCYLGMDDLDTIRRRKLCREIK